jgi:PAS domain S-box-containing protein
MHHELTAPKTPIPAPEPRIERLHLLSIVLPLAYVAAVVGFLAFNPLPSWASSLVAVAVSAPLVAAFTAVVFNVVNTMRADLLKREQHFANLLEAAPDGIVIAGADGVIVMANHEAERLFGYTKQELVGTPVEALIPEPARGRHTNHRETFQREPSLRPMGAGLELVALRKDGTTFPVEISLSPIAQDGQLLVNAVIRDISERLALEAEREQLRAETETQAERERIAMDLHDGIIQSIYAVTLGLEATMEDISRESTGDIRHRIDRSMTELDDVTRDIRSYIFHLRPPRGGEPLPESLKLLADDFRVNSLIDTSLALPDEFPGIEEARSVAAYHIAREALNNVRKHGKATRVAISLANGNGALRLEVADNGIGFDPGDARSGDHHGLENMRTRARAIGATLTIDTSRGGGTRVRLEMPLRHPPKEA